jgi:hypothetical protein
MWQRLLDWLKGKKPAARRAAETLEDLARKVEGEIDEALPDRVRGVRTPRARYLVMILVLAICAVTYWRGWHGGLVKQALSLLPVATQDGGTVYQGDQVPAIAKAAQKGKARARTSIRPVITIPAEELPAEERGKIPAVAAAAGPDNVVRPPELATTAVVPPSRGETHVRAYVMPSGAVQATLELQREHFWGWAWKRVEIEGEYGLVGNTTVKGLARWLPLRAGNLHAGVEGSVATEQGGVIRGEGLVVIRYEPFRDSYR